jgi:hypothetical protein
MASLSGQDVRPEELRPADHVYVETSPQHVFHGLVVEVHDSQDEPLDRVVVLHLSCVEAPSAKVQQSTLREFLDTVRNEAGWTSGDASLKLARYGLSWSECKLWQGVGYPIDTDVVPAVLWRARALLEISELRPHDLGNMTVANAEHVVVWCKTSQWRSTVQDKIRSADSALSLASAAALAAGAAAACRRSPGVALLPLLGGALMWKAAHDQGRHQGGLGGAPAALCKHVADKDPMGDAGANHGLDSETDYVVVYEADVAAYLLAAA